nr:hypothetical protein [Tanacetum cinerariifolium]
MARLSKEPIPKELLAWYGYDIVKDLPVVKKPILKVSFKSHTPFKGCLLRLANVETWDNIMKKFGMKTPERCAKKSKGKRKRNQSLPVRYANGASDDSDSNLPNKKMKMKLEEKEEDQGWRIFIHLLLNGDLDLLHLHLLVGAVGVGGAVRVANRPTPITLRVGAVKKSKKRFL